jgi:4-amino-4-deoxychorismate lyase
LIKYMLQLIETICFEKGAFQRIPLHEERMNRSRHHFFGSTDKISLGQHLIVPESLKNETLKCRVTYSEEIEQIEYEVYTVKHITSLKLVRDDTIDYNYKFRDRVELNNLLKMRGDSDEILIIKNGEVTDTSFTNIVFLKEGKWFTPEHPLLPGTRREYYIRMNLIKPISITPDDLWQFEEARLINSMRSLEDGKPILISDICRPD